MKWIFWILNKIFLVKVILSQEGELHFKRYRILSLPWFKIYLHKICLPDYDLHMHSHPWNFYSLILKGAYTESYSVPDYFNVIHTKLRPWLSIIHHDRYDVHQIESLNNDNPVWTLVFAYGKYKEWGYRFKSNDSASELDSYVDHKMYRQMKNQGYFDSFGRLLK